MQPRRVKESDGGNKKLLKNFDAKETILHGWFSRNYSKTNN